MFKHDYIFIIPTYNEATIIERSIILLMNFLLHQWPNAEKKWAIVVADNGSSDDTQKIVTSLQQKYSGKLYYEMITEAGRGRALQIAMRHYPATMCCYIDADIPLAPEDIAQLIHPVTNTQADLAIIKRTGPRPKLRAILSKILQLLNMTLFEVSAQDAQCGAKVLSERAVTVAMNDCKEIGYFLDTELLAQCAKQNLKIVEVPLRWIEQRYVDRKSKVRPIKDSLQACAAVGRIFFRTYPKTLLESLLVLASGGLLFWLFWLTATQLVLSNFRVMEYFDQFDIWDQLFIAYSLAYCLIVGVISLSTIKWRAHLLLTAFVFIVLSIIAIITHPIGSPDVYWNLLLGKGWTHYNLNPYHTTPNHLLFDDWSVVIKSWRDLAMTHGPLWTMILGLVTIGTTSLTIAVLKIKFLAFILLALSGYILWKISHNAKMISLLMLNPFILQMVLIDVHNDIYIMFGLLMSYYLFTKKRYPTSAVVLLLAGLVKYVSWFALPIPLYFWLKQQKNPLHKVLMISGFVAVSVGIISITYAPFGFRLTNLTGISNEIAQRGNESYSTLGAYWLSEVFHLTITQIRLVGALAALLVMWLLIKLNKPLLAYTLPYVTIWGLGTTWFQPWYVLWIWPLLLLFLPESLVIVLTTALLLTPTTQRPLEMSIIFIGIVGLWWVLRKLNTFWYSSKARRRRAGPPELLRSQRRSRT